ncbi:MAG: hypothetical protein GABPV2_gp1 [Guiyang argiope bruennichi polycipivirus 2]|nr:MAG: hypothetical protein GABPV2_gp1 [Guiyang argiope bruennichi polycipivirus 2]
MSFLETNPITNPTSVQQRDNQQIFSQNTDPMSIDFPFYRELTPFKNPQVTIPGVSSMEKPIFKATWSTSNNINTEIFHIELDFALIRNHIATFGISNQVFANFNAFVITLRRTDMANYQGLALLAFDPAPSPNYYNTVFGIPFATKNDFQLDLIKIVEPKTSEDIVFAVPFHIPFEMLQIQNNADPLTNYHSFYSFGTIRLSVLQPLETTNATQSLEYRVSGYLTNLSTAGNVFKS